jgi:hypothetical protein
MAFATIYDEIAVKYGLNESIIINKLCTWIKHNSNHGKNYIDGHTWTFMSFDGMHRELPYLSLRTIKRTIKRLEEIHVIKSGNYNKKAYDRTKWYTVTCDLCLSIHCVNTKMAQSIVPKWHNGRCQNGTMEDAKMTQPIPTYKKNNNKNKGVKNTPPENQNQELKDSDIRLTLTGDERLKLKAHYPGVNVNYYEEAVASWAKSRGAKIKKFYYEVKSWIIKDDAKGGYVKTKENVVQADFNNEKLKQELYEIRKKRARLASGT